MPLYSKEFKEEGFWTTVYYNAYVTAYNTRSVPARQLREILRRPAR